MSAKAPTPPPKPEGPPNDRARSGPRWLNALIDWWRRPEPFSPGDTLGPSLVFARQPDRVGPALERIAAALERLATPDTYVIGTEEDVGVPPCGVDGHTWLYNADGDVRECDVCRLEEICDEGSWGPA